ncbi:phage late control D family protein [Bradyrhizobium sp. HKCCYLS2038]|uniref:phage late control D family protein n=1 Tax=unclassified Bradyrhizobium TaxID=2631580 RepID=UPI003EBCCE2D
MAADLAIYRVIVDGNDISNLLNPILITLRVHDAAGTASDTADIEIDDTNGRVAFPRDGSYMAIDLGWRSRGIARVFEGTVDDVKSRGARGQGRTLHITAKSADTRGKTKQHHEKHWDKSTLGSVMQDAAGLAGVQMMVDPALASIERDWWGMTAESFLHFGHRIARDVGGSFKVFGRRAILVKRNAGLSVSGSVLSTVTAQWGINLIDWDIAPVVGRPRYAKVRARWYDAKEARWKEEAVDIEGRQAQAEATVRFTRPAKDEAARAAENGKGASERNRAKVPSGSSVMSTPSPKGCASSRVPVLASAASTGSTSSTTNSPARTASSRRCR